MSTQKRKQTFVWPSWVSKLVAGEDQCVWKYWFKAHFTYDKLPGDFNLARWNINHNKLLQTRRAELEKDGFTVRVEDQNSFRYILPNGTTISGKADLIGITCETSLVEDCKTGSPKTSDYVQVIFYMLFIPLSIEKYKNKIFKGTIIYKEGTPNMSIAPDQIDAELKQFIWDAIKQISGDEANCRRVPSEKECKRCDIPNCPERKK